MRSTLGCAAWCLASTIFAAEWTVTPEDASALNRAQSGDVVLFAEGVYAEPIEFRGLEDVTLRPADGAKVVFDGTDLLPNEWKRVTPDSAEGRLIQPAQWERMRGALYSLKVEEPVYALIHEGRLMSTARWPNARWDDPWRLDRYMVLRMASVGSVRGRIQDGLPTENTLEESEKWIHYDRSALKHREETLGDTGISFENAVAVMSHTWGSWATRVTGHAAGESAFEYDTEFEGSGSIQHEAKGYLNHRIGWERGDAKFKKSGHGGIHFFFMGLPALDIEEEWWYDDATRTIYFIAPGGRPPKDVRGKRRDFLLTAKNCEGLVIQGFDFHGCAALVEWCENSRLEDCDFRFAASHKFVVGNYDIPVTTRIASPRGQKVKGKLFGNALINCSFTYQDGNAFEGRSTGLVIDNVLIERTQQTTLGLDSRSMSIDRPSVVRRVTINDVGASVGIKGGGVDSVYELNNIARFGGLQYDGASLQMGGREKFIYRYNWSHDHPKRSYRFDAGSFPDFANAFGEMSYNVAWNTPGGFALKGDDHLLHNNLILDGGFELFNMKRWASKNERTLVANNIVPRMSAGGYDWDKPVLKKSTKKDEVDKVEDYWFKETKVPDDHPTSIGESDADFDDGHQRGPRKAPLLAILKNNYMGSAEEVLRDPANLDFRPKKGAEIIGAGHVITQKDVPWKTVPFTGAGRTPDIGPYGYGTDSYWIPGYKHASASTPVPPDGTTTAKPDCGLMWLGGYKAEAHHLYIGSSADAVAAADRESRLFRGTFNGERNVHDFKKPLPAGTTVYWRVDAVRDGETIPGSVWRFRVGE